MNLAAVTPLPGHRAGIPLGRVFGCKLRLHWSVLLLASVLLVLYGQAAGYLLAVGFVALLLTSVLLHELGHALTARRLGIGVRGITLEILGGYTELDRPAPSPRVELLVSLAGPAVSLLLGGAAVAGMVVLPAGSMPRQLLFLTAAANLLVAAFNLLPGLPLDGGRALRAVVWAATGSPMRGTAVAARCGQVVGLGTGAAAVGLSLADLISPFGLLLLLVIAFTLWQGAATSSRLARMSGRVSLIDVDQLARPVFPVATGTPLAEAQRRLAETGPPRAVLGVADSTGQLRSLVQPAAAKAVPESRRPWVAVDTVAREVATMPVVPGGTRGADALSVLQSTPAREYLVTAGPQVVGVLWAADVARLLNSRPTREQR